MFQVGYFLTRNAGMFPDRLAVVHGDRELTYGQLNKAANRLANNLSSMGLRKGERVAFMLPNSVEIVILWHATQKLGLTALPVNSRVNADEVAYILNDTQATAFIYSDRYEEKAADAVQRSPSLKYIILKNEAPSQDEADLDHLIDLGSEQEPDVPVKGEDESVIMYTSGTTGRPKGVMHTHSMVREYSYMMTIENDQSSRPDVTLVQSPMFHLGGMQHVWRMAAACGTIVMVNRIIPEEIFGDIEKYRVTQLYILPPILFKRLYGASGWRDRDLSSVRCVMCTGGKCSEDISDMIFEMFPGALIRLSYGSTEIFGPTLSFVTQDMIARRPELATTLGTINTQYELRLVDKDLRDVPDGEPGEALVRSPMVFRGYLNLPELNARAFEPGHWFHTEDILRRSPDGYYFMVDRKKDMIKTGGENVYAQEVEGALKDFPEVYDCAVIGLPDPEFGEAVAAAIVVCEGARLEPLDFLQRCRGCMPSYKKPRYWALLDSLPVNSVGKIQKSVLREHPEWFSRIS